LKLCIENWQIATKPLNKVVGQLTGVTMHPSGIKPHACFILLQERNFRKNMLTGKKLGYRVLTSRLLP